MIFIYREKSNMKKHLEKLKKLQMPIEGQMLILTSLEQRWKRYYYSLKIEKNNNEKKENI